MYPSHKLIDQKLNTGNHEEGSSHLNPQQWTAARSEVTWGGKTHLEQAGIWKLRNKDRMGRLMRRNVTVFPLQTGKLEQGGSQDYAGYCRCLNLQKDTPKPQLLLSEWVWGLGDRNDSTLVLGEFKTRKYHCPVKKHQWPRWGDEERPDRAPDCSESSHRHNLEWSENSLNKGLSRSHSSSGMLSGNLLNWAKYGRKSQSLGVALFPMWEIL